MSRSDWTLVLVLIYFVPTFIAKIRCVNGDLTKRRLRMIGLFNTLFGIIPFVWLGCLIAAFARAPDDF